MTRIADICDYLADEAPLDLAEDWDNVGLLAGDRHQPAGRLMTCLTISPGTVDEAVGQNADLVVTHHPLPFRPVKRLVLEDQFGGLLWRLARAGIGVYSAHTAWDSAALGINQLICQRFALHNILPLVPNEPDSATGSGRVGELAKATTLTDFADTVKQIFDVPHLKLVGDPTRTVQRVGVACGSAGSFLAAADDRNCDVFITGETTFHTCLEAEHRGVAMILTGHYASERFSLEVLAARINDAFEDVEAWASQHERDPIRWH